MGMDSLFDKTKINKMTDYVKMDQSLIKKKDFLTISTTN